MMFKISIEKQSLSQCVSKLSGILSDKSLVSIGLSAADGKLTVTSSDHVIAIYASSECQVHTAGTIFVTAKLFAETVKELPNSLVTLELTDSFMLVSAMTDLNEKYQMKVPLVEHSVWRNPPEPDLFDLKTLPSDKMSYMIEQVQFCIMPDSPRVYGSVGYLHSPEKGVLRMVGTDGFRLSHCDVTLPEAQQKNAEIFEKGVNFSKRAIQEILRVCHQGYKDVSIGIDQEGKTALLQVENLQVFIRLVEIKYPSYAGVIPKTLSNEVEVGRPHIATAVKRVLIAADKSRALRFEFDHENLVLQSRTSGSSESTEALKLPGFKTKKSSITVNGKFLSDILSTSNVDKLKISFQEDKLEDPLVFFPMNEPEGCFSKHLLVPIKESR